MAALICFWCPKLISLKLIFVACWPFKFHCRHSDLAARQFIRVRFHCLKFVFRELGFVARLSIKWNLHFLIGILWDRSTFNSGWLDILGFIGSSSLKFDLRRSIILSWRFIYLFFVFFRVYGFDSKRFVLIFVRSCSNKWHLIDYFALHNQDIYADVLKSCGGINKIIDLRLHIIFLIVRSHSLRIIMALLISIIVLGNRGGLIFNFFIRISIRSWEISLDPGSWAMMFS